MNDKFNDNNVTVNQLKQKMVDFVSTRTWNKYHKPKNLSMSIAIEAAELMEHFQWEDDYSNDMDTEKIQAIQDEMADIFAYLLSLSNVLKIDLTSSFMKKMEQNEIRFPKTSKFVPK